MAMRDAARQADVGDARFGHSRATRGVGAARRPDPGRREPNVASAAAHRHFPPPATRLATRPPTLRGVIEHDGQALAHFTP